MLAEALVCLALNVYHEARGEPIEGQYAVAHVVRNRVADSHWPDTVCDVVYQRQQFSWYNAEMSYELNDGAAWIQALTIAQQVLNNCSIDPTDGAVFYHADWVSPYWAAELTVTTVLGDHVFYTKR